MIYAGSRFTKPEEFNYSPTEGEALAVTWSLHNSRMFTLGCPDLIVAVDHKPLLGILNDRDLSSIQNPRLQSLKEGTFFWQFKIVYNPGKWHRGPDAVSRNPVPETKAFVSRIFMTNQQVDDLNTNHDAVFEILLVAHLEEISNGAITVDHVMDGCKNDEHYQQLIKLITKGFPNKRQDLPQSLREFWEVRSRLSHYNGVLSSWTIEQ